jgi:type I restriction enzyme, R subunit
MTPDAKAHQQIDQKLEQAGCFVHDMKQLNLAASVGVAECEYPTDTGPADYSTVSGEPIDESAEYASFN